ncbi:ABC transporter permease [Flavihumibacter petaseus]|uniref:Putative ABC transporter permease protein n=1 Tax=Flavihumibacter petaseus NBRC 106054 TaxID=1220578 RepID=A0A0E9MVG2_9BACT|nr:ABC transporter permease [Flavihumibacter petaseus]GAO41569.1 putative ABC transporter permease protein [Flavihumibacter petaseus NBRC 106054]
MLLNYIKVAWRNLAKSKGYSLINIGGLAIGMAVAILIGLWIWDELSFDKYHSNYDKLARVMQHQTFNGKVGTQFANPAVTAQEIRNKYPNDFKWVLQSSWNFQHTLAVGQKKLLKEGSFFEPGVIEMLGLQMLRGDKQALKDPYSIVLSRSVATAFFGDNNPMGKTMRLDNKTDVKVTGVYEDLPHNTSFRELKYILTWDLYLSSNPWIQKMENPWGSNFTQTFAQVADNADMEKVSKKIHDVKLNALPANDRNYKPVMFLHPMKKWHLYADFKEGINTGGRIEYLWLFGIIGVFVLLLACINFMNLSTARSEKRAREVGVRKAIGSARSQLIGQFFSESFVVVILALVLSILLVILFLPYFNQLSDKKLAVLWTNPYFWLLNLAVCLFTGLIAGSYPALYLSSFQPVKVLKGTFRAGRFASIPRKVLVVLQFSVSVILVIGTIVVYRQIQHAKNRPIGYNKDSMVYVSTNDIIHTKFEAIRHDLKANGTIVEMAESGSPATEVWNSNGGFDWEGKDPNFSVDFPNNAVSYDFGKVLNWQIKEGRDFSRDFASDSAAFILNESAVKFIGFENPVGKTLIWEDKPYTIIGIVKDMLVESPYAPIRASLWHMTKDAENVITLRINPKKSASAAVASIEKTFAQYDPSTAFEFRFVDDQFNRKFGEEERIGKLATCFAVLAILISCLGLFGLASFVAEQRTKEIGVRKVLGASVANLWQMLSRDFVLLVVIACILAVPIAWYGMFHWLQKYDYRTPISWWVFGAAVFGALFITLLTVSFQAVKAARANPIKSLRTE